MKKLVMFLIGLGLAFALLAADAGAEDPFIDPQPSGLEPTTIALYGYDGQIILGIKNVRTENLIVEVGDPAAIEGIYDEDGREILHHPHIDGWEWIAMWGCLIVGMIIGGML